MKMNGAKLCKWKAKQNNGEEERKGKKREESIENTP